MNKTLIVKEIDEELIEKDVLKEDNKEVIISANTYKKLIKKSNEINEELTLQVNDHEEKCIIHALKDIKQCNISFESNNISKKTIDQVIDYCFNVLLMETLFIEVDEKSNIIKQLNKMGFEDIGLVNDKVTFLKEKEEKDLERVSNGHNKKH